MSENERHRLTVFLLPTKRDRHRLVSPELEEELAARLEEVEPDVASDAEAGAELEAGDESSLRRALRRGWRAGVRWLKARGGATERVLRELRLPEAVEVIHPAGLPRHAAQRIYRQKVEDSVTRHRRWLLVDGALLPLSVVFSLVPGPNLLLPYLAWRTLSHWRGQAGGARALGGDELDVTFAANPELDPLLDLADKWFVLHRKRRLREIGERVNIPNLDRHL